MFEIIDHKLNYLIFICTNITLLKELFVIKLSDVELLLIEKIKLSQ